MSINVNTSFGDIFEKYEEDGEDLEGGEKREAKRQMLPSSVMPGLSAMWSTPEESDPDIVLVPIKECTSSLIDSDDWTQFSPIQSTKNVMEFHTQDLILPLFSSEKTFTPFEMSVSLKTKARRTERAKKEKMKIQNVNAIKQMTSVKCTPKMPKYVVCTGQTPRRYGVKMKLCGHNVRIGNKYVDPCSAARVAMAAKQYVHASSKGKLSISKKIDFPYKSSVYIKGKSVERSIEVILHDFVTLHNAKRSWRSTNLSSEEKPRTKVFFGTRLSEMTFVENFPEKLQALRDGYMKDLVTIHQSLNYVMPIIHRSILDMEKELTSRKDKKDVKHMIAKMKTQYERLHSIMDALKGSPAANPRHFADRPPYFCPPQAEK